MSGGTRVEGLRERLSGEKAAAAVVLEPSNIAYLTGFTGVFDEMMRAAVVVTATVARIYIDSRYIEATERAAAGTMWEVRRERVSLYTELCDDLGSEGATDLVMETSVSYSLFRTISDRFSGEVRVEAGWVEGLRAVKEDVEIEAIARSAALTDAAFDHVLGLIRPGMREIDVSLALEVYMRSNGSDGLAFPPIVASGPNSSRPHAGVSQRVIGEGELLTMDFGARVDGYCADLTRTVVVGSASDEQRRIYDAVLEANQAGIAAVAAGIEAVALDRAAREVLERHGLAEHFTHGLGHGVGLDVHEMPTLGSRSKDIVSAGAVITIEPGVYLPGFGGVRIEDLVAVLDSGTRVLSAAPKSLIEVR